MNLVDFYRRFPDGESYISYLKIKREEQSICMSKNVDVLITVGNHTGINGNTDPDRKDNGKGYRNL